MQPVKTGFWSCKNKKCRCQVMSGFGFFDGFKNHDSEISLLQGAEGKNCQRVQKCSNISKNKFQVQPVITGFWSCKNKKCRLRFLRHLDFFARSNFFRQLYRFPPVLYWDVEQTPNNVLIPYFPQMSKNWLQVMQDLHAKWTPFSDFIFICFCNKIL